MEKHSSNPSIKHFFAIKPNINPIQLQKRNVVYTTNSKCEGTADDEVLFGDQSCQSLAEGHVS